MPTPTKVGSEFIVNTTTPFDQTEPSVAGLTNGRFVVAWQDPSQTGSDSSNNAIRAQLFDPNGSKSGAEFLVNTTANGSQDMPAVAALSGGRFVIVWRDGNNFGTSVSFDIRAQIFDANGGKVGTEFLVNTTTLGAQGWPEIVTLVDGRFVVSWNDANSHVKAQIFNDNGTKAGSDFFVDNFVSGKSGTAASSDTSSIAALPNGGFVVAWGDYSSADADPFSNAVHAQVFNAAGAKVGPELTVNTTTVNNQERPAITTFSDGRFAVSWDDSSPSETAPSPRTDVRAQVFNANGTKFGSEILVASDTSEVEPESSILALPDGRFIVSWFGNDSVHTNSSVVAQVFNSDGSKDGSRIIVSTTASNPQKLPTTDILADGNVVVAWKSGSDGSIASSDRFSDSIRAQILDVGFAKTINATSGPDVLTGTASDDTLDGLAGNDTIMGLAGFDTLIGGAGNDTLDGGSNPSNQGDFLLGGAGDDTYYVDSPLDFVDEGSVFPQFGFGGTDTIISTADFFWDLYSVGEVIQIAANAVDIGNDGTTIVGGVFNNTLIGNAGTNVMFGRGGSDIYKAGDGIDFISLSTLGVPDAAGYTANGSNTVVVTPRGSGPTSYDIVFEFESGKDKIDLSAYHFASTADVLAHGVNDGAGSSYYVLGDGLDYLYMVGLERGQLGGGDFII